MERAALIVSNVEDQENNWITMLFEEDITTIVKVLKYFGQHSWLDQRTIKNTVFYLQRFQS